MKILKQYFELQKQIYDYFGYQEDWATIPLQDYTDAFWWLRENKSGDGEIQWSYKTSLTPEKIRSGTETYSATIYTQRFLPKWVYRAKDYTMICIDTHCDGNKFLAVFDNLREQKTCPEFEKALKDFNAGRCSLY